MINPSVLPPSLRGDDISSTSSSHSKDVKEKDILYPPSLWESGGGGGGKLPSGHLCTVQQLRRQRRSYECGSGPKGNIDDAGCGRHYDGGMLSQGNGGGTSYFSRGFRQQEQRRMDDFEIYVSRHVEPLFLEAIVHVIQVTDCNDEDVIGKCLFTYFKNMRQQTTPHNKNDKNDDKVDTIYSRQQRRRGPKIINKMCVVNILASLMTHIVLKKPPDLLSFIISSLSQRYEKEELSLPPMKAAPQVAPRQVAILLIGPSGAGKSSMVNTLRGIFPKSNKRTKPTLGFCPVVMKYGKDDDAAGSAIIKFYDLGGSKKIRGIWDNYYHDVHGVVYVLDASGEEEELEEAIALSKLALGHKYLQGKPLLIICNNKEQTSSSTPPRSFYSIQLKMNVTIHPQGFNRMIAARLIPLQQEQQQNTKENVLVDPALEGGLEWLVTTILQNYQDIQNRVTADVAIETIKNTKQQEEKEQRVMRTSICKAFGLEGQTKTDAYTKEEGERFLANELGVPQLPLEGATVAKLVGYQKLAMIMIGTMIVPISRKKRKYTWEEVIAYVQGVRNTIKDIQTTD